MKNNPEKLLILEINDDPLFRKPWSISEIDELSENAAKNQFPWIWQFDFNLNNINITNIISTPDAYERHKECLVGDDRYRIRERSRIYADLQPNKYSTSQFSMFGASEPIEFFIFYIIPSYLGSEEGLRIYGNRTSSIVNFELTLGATKFRRIAQRIERQLITGARLFVQNVDGIYSSVDANYNDYNRHFKMLSIDTESQPLILPPDFHVDPPRLGAVKDFELQLYSSNSRNDILNDDQNEQLKSELGNSE